MIEIGTLSSTQSILAAHQCVNLSAYFLCFIIQKQCSLLFIYIDSEAQICAVEEGHVCRSCEEVDFLKVTGAIVLKQGAKNIGKLHAS